MPPRRVIKRYANRKLYDTRDSRYVTLQQIAEYVRLGEEVSIVDNTTKEDLTNVTLAQIVYEEERKTDPTQKGTSVNTLRAFIQDGSERLLATLKEVPVAKFVTAKVEEGTMKTTLFSPKTVVEELQRLADDRIRGLLGHAINQVHQLGGEVKRMQDKIDELERKLIDAQSSRVADPKAPQEKPSERAPAKRV